MEAPSADSPLQQVASSSRAQRVITFVADGVPLGNLQAAIPTSGITQPFIVTMQNGQQGEERGYVGLHYIWLGYVEPPGSEAVYLPIFKI